MPKICEYCKQPYPDNLPSCPQCDVFGADLLTTTPPPPPAGKPPIEVTLGSSSVRVMGDGGEPRSSSAVDLGGEQVPGLEAFTPASASSAPPGGPSKPPSSQQPATRVQGPLPPKPGAPATQNPIKPGAPATQ